MEKFHLNKHPSEQSSEIPRELTPPERSKLRNTLKALGVAVAVLAPSKTSETHTVGDIVRYEVSAQSESEPESEIISATENSAETHSPNEIWKEYEAAQQLRMQLRRDQVMATTSRGELLAGPIDLEPRLGWEVTDMVSPTERNNGEIQGIPGQYLAELRDMVRDQTELSSNEEIQIQHVYLSLQQVDDPSMSIADLATERLHAFPEGESQSYAELIENHFHPRFSDHANGEYLTDALKRVLPALITKESMFSSTAVSSVGARAELQILPSTFDRYADTDADPQHFPTQLEVASRYFEASFRYLTTNLANELDAIRVGYFDDDELAFTEHFLFPLLINAYNAGDGNMQMVVEWFIRTYPDPQEFAEVFGAKKTLAPADVYYAMATLAREQEAVSSYGKYASAYALDIIATAPTLSVSDESSNRLASLQ